MNNKGISLISLIITIIVIIILAAIVIFTGLGTPDSANFAHFCQDCDNVGSQVLNKYASLKVKHATNNETRTDEQIYAEIALGSEVAATAQYSAMDYSTDAVKEGSTSGDIPDSSAAPCQRIVPGASGLSLPKVRESVNAWYVTANGQVFNATGYYYDGNTYFNATVRTAGETSVNVDTTEVTGADKERARAKDIAVAIIAGNTTI